MLRSWVQMVFVLPLLVVGSHASTCLTTIPSNPPFTPPIPQQSMAISVHSFWHGTEKLWTLVPIDGTWKGLRLYGPNTRGYRQKVFWWSEDYDVRTEPRPKLIVTGHRLDGDAPSFALNATNAFSSDIGSAMLVGVDIPTHGCWEITGHYRGRTLSFVVSVEP